MNILLLTYGLPYPPDRGPRVKTYQLLRHLAGRHRVTLVCLVHERPAADHIAALEPHCAEIHIVQSPLSFRRRLSAVVESVFGSRPALVARNDCQPLHDLLARLLNEAAVAGRPFDLVHADQIQMAQFAEGLPLPRLYDAHNAVYQIVERLAEQRRLIGRWRSRREAAQLRAYEGRICASFEAVTAVSVEDRDSLVAVAGIDRPVSIIPIGVDGQAMQPAPPANAGRTVLSLSSPDWPPNVEGIAWFAREVFPLVRRAVPDGQCYICGADPAPVLRELGERQPGIAVTGFVDPQPYLEQAAVAIAPLRSSGGMRVALIETLARGIPMVATSRAIAGLELVAGEHLLVADTPSDFADAVTLLLCDPELGARIGAAGRAHTLERYDWRALSPALDLVYAQLTAQSAPLSAEALRAQPVAIRVAPSAHTLAGRLRGYPAPAATPCATAPHAIKERPMDVLYICAEAPNLGHPRPYGLISALGRRGHSVTLLFGDEAGAIPDDLAKRCRTIIPVRRRQLAEAAIREAKTTAYDLIHVDRSAAGVIAGPLPQPTVLDAAICASLRQERALRSLGPLTRAAQSARLPALRREEASFLQRFQRVIVAGEDDAAALRGLAPNDTVCQGGVHVVPSPVDLERLGPPTRLRDPATILLDLREIGRAEGVTAIGAIGAVLPAIWAQRADTRLTVIGPVPLGGAGWLAGDPRIVFTGPVHDPRGQLMAATLMVAPVGTAGGLPHGPLEALATATPLIAHSALARDLGAQPDEELLAVDTPPELLRAILALLDDPPLRGKIGRAGRKHVERRHRWELVLPALEEVYGAAAGSAMSEWRIAVGLDRPRTAE